jgi:phage terminase large subunit
MSWGSTNEDRLSIATHTAMLVIPRFAQIGVALTSGKPDDRRHLLNTTPKPMLEEALEYVSYPPEERERERCMKWMRKDPRRVALLRHFYRHSPEGIADFIHDWGITIDPRAVAEGRPALVPFKLWPKQRKLVNWILERFRTGTPGVVVKGRDVGASWIGMAVLCVMGVFENRFAGGIASATEVKLDRSGDPDTLMFKATEFVRYLPEEFRAGFDDKKHAHYLRMSFPDTQSTLTGEAGDNTGRGGRKSIYIVDESAFFEHPQLIDASLAATTNCRIDISTPHGINAFFERANNPAIARFDIDWRDDPRKDQAWYDKKKTEMDSVVFAQEIDANFFASAEGVLIPPQWVAASLGLLEFLKMEPTGSRVAALDVSDVGKDECALVGRHGQSVALATKWTGQGSDTTATTVKAFGICDQNEFGELVYDATGVGSGVRGAARVLNEKRVEEGTDTIIVSEFVAGATPIFPERKVPGTNRKAKDLFLNRSAQAAWHLRLRFQEAFKARNGQPFDPELIISIDPKLPELSRLTAQLSQPQVKETATGKIQLEKTPKGARSPNLFDALSYVFAPRVMPMNISDKLLASIGSAPGMPSQYAGREPPQTDASRIAASYDRLNFSSRGNT